MLPLQRKPAALEILTMIVIEKNRKHLRLRHHHFLFQEFPSYLVFDLFTLDMQKPINTYKIWHFYYPYDQMHGLYSPTFTPTNNPASKVVCINTMCIYTILYTTYMYIMYIYIYYYIKLHYAEIHHTWSIYPGARKRCGLPRGGRSFAGASHTPRATVPWSLWEYGIPLQLWQF